MVLIHTTVKELDEVLNKTITDSKIAYYPEYLLEEEKADTVVMSSQTRTKIPLKDFLFALRCQDKRIVLILDEENSPLLGYALALGIYDIVIREVNPNSIVKILESPPKFSRAARFFVGLKKAVSFDKEIAGESNPENGTGEESRNESAVQKAGNADGESPDAEHSAGIIPSGEETTKDDIEAAKRQVGGLLKLLKADNNVETLNEMLVALEDVIADLIALSGLPSEHK